MRSIISWLYGHLKSFAVIVLILLAAHLFQRELAQFTRTAQDIGETAARRDALAAFVAGAKAEAKRSVEAAEREASDTLERRLRALDAEIERRQAHGGRIGAMQVLTADVDAVKAAIALALLRKERAYLGDVLAIREAKHQLRLGGAELERLRRRHVGAYAALAENERDQARLESNHPIASRTPGTGVWTMRQALRARHTVLHRANEAAHADYERQRKLLAMVKMPAAPDFDAFAAEVDRVLAPLDEKLAALRQSQRTNWVHALSQPVMEVLPTALLILLPIVFAPLLIKAFLYFLIAPLASRRAPITLLPDASGAIAGTAGLDGEHRRARVSAVSQPVRLAAGDELLIHAEYLQSSAQRGAKNTQWLLDWRYPLTSLASGMFALIRIRAAGDETYVVSATRDPLSEVGLLSIPAGSAVILQPHNLVGIVQRCNAPTRITRHWRLGTLHAWLTLQLRYLAFHGPVTLVARGCRGIQIERADAGRAINQAATIGFSADLAYSTRRCETFFAYLTGKQELFNDTFSGAGCFIYEEMPHYGRRTGVYGRGIEGIADSVLKVFGV